MEARLVNYDLTIISGLIDGEFPSKNSDDWLGNKIRADFGLPNLNKKIGVLAYDFCNYLGAKEVILTCPQNKNNTPTLKSRFLLRMEALMKINNINKKEFWQNIEKSPEDKSFFNSLRPQPKSPIAIEKVSATDISKWIRNPYFIYAKRILKLQPLKQIEQEVSFAEFGNFIHKVFEIFVKNYPKIAAKENLEKSLNNYAEKYFPRYFPNPEARLLWWPRFKNIANWFLNNEKKLRQNNCEVFSEIEAKANINNVEITTKIDRINLYKDGSIEIIDYKTGLIPSQKDVNSGLEPQLAIEAVILILGQSNNINLDKKISLEQIRSLQYWQLKGRDANKIKTLNKAQELTQFAKEGLTKLIGTFYDKKATYICYPDFDIYKEDDYYHLGRIEEWK
jgi:ATP-dependent helicase/nuclease subunit B